MADDEQFSLCWNNFNSNLSAGFHESLCRGDLVDVTLAAEGQFVKAHRLVLSVCSPYFRKMFTQMPANQHAFVFLKDVSHSALKDLIQFMYCGEVNVKQDALPAFISTAEALQIKGLTDGEPAPSQSPAKPSTPAPQQTIPAPSMTATSPRVRTQRSSTTRTYKLESEDSGDDKPQIVLQTQNQQQQIVQQQQQTQKRPAQRSITPHTMPTVKRVKNSDPLEATDPTQITVQTVSDNKSSGGEAEFIDLPIDLPTKSEPDYAEDAGEVETAEQEATYVEDDSYGDMKYDESYFTENDETGAATAGATTSGATTVKTQGGTFSESYVSDTGDQSATEAQGAPEESEEKVNAAYPTKEVSDDAKQNADESNNEEKLQVIEETILSENTASENISVDDISIDASVNTTVPLSEASELAENLEVAKQLKEFQEHPVVYAPLCHKSQLSGETSDKHDTTEISERNPGQQGPTESLGSPELSESGQTSGTDVIPLHSGSKVYVSKQDMVKIFSPVPKIYISKLTDLLFRDLIDGGTVRMDVDRAQSLITHVLEVFRRKGEPISEDYVRKIFKVKLYRMTKAKTA